MLILDLSVVPSEKSLARIERLVRKGAALWLADATPGSESVIARLTGQTVSFDSLSRSSFLPGCGSWMSGLNNSDFYFCEVQKQDVSSFTFHGNLVRSSETLLSACRTDWRAWNFRPEEIKTAAVLRSEQECRAALPVILRHGNIWVSVPLDFASTAKGSKTLAVMLSNAGIQSDRHKAGTTDTKIVLGGADKLLLDPSVDTSKKAK